MVEQSGEPLLLSFPCYFSHTVQPLGHALPVLCRVHVRLSDVLPRLCPSLPGLRGKLPSLSAGSQVVRHSPTSPARTCPQCGLWPSRTGLDRQTKACWRSPGSRACCFSACAGSQTTQDRNSHSRLAWLPFCLPPTRNEVGILIYGLFAAQSPRPPMPLVYASSVTSR